MSETDETTPTQPDEVTETTVEEPIETGWYAYSGGAQFMLFHLDDQGQWWVHAANGSADQCVWSYIEQALGVWTLDRIPLPVPSPVLNPPETLTRLVDQWGAESIYDAFITRWPQDGPPDEAEQPHQDQYDLVESYEVESVGDGRSRLLIDGKPLPWYTHRTGLMVAPYSDDPADARAGVHIVWVPLMADGPLPTPPVGTPQAAAFEAAEFGPPPPADDGTTSPLADVPAVDKSAAITEGVRAGERVRDAAQRMVAEDDDFPRVDGRCTLCGALPGEDHNAVKHTEVRP